MGHKQQRDSSTLSSSTQQDGYRVALSDGSLSAIYKVEHGRSTLKRADSDESWALNGNQLIKTEQEHGVTQTTVYTDSDGDGVYQAVRTGSDDGAIRLSGVSDDAGWPG